MAGDGTAYRAVIPDFKNQESQTITITPASDNLTVSKSKVMVCQDMYLTKSVG